MNEKENRRAISKRYRERNPERFAQLNRASRRRFAENNPEANAAIKKRYYEKNAESIRAKARQAREQRGEEIRRRAREKYAANPSRKIESAKKWREKKLAEIRADLPPRPILTLEERLEKRRRQQRESTAAYRKRHPDRDRASNLKSNRKFREKDPVAHIERAKAWYWANQERARRKRRDERSQNPEEVRARDRERYAKNPELKKAAGKRWLAKNPDAAPMYGSERRRHMRHAMPPWITKEHKAQITEFRRQARRLTKETGIPHHVDHIHPLRGKNFCGLHVPWNLQVIPWKENFRKGNKLLENSIDHSGRSLWDCRV